MIKAGFIAFFVFSVIALAIWGLMTVLENWGED